MQHRPEFSPYYIGKLEVQYKVIRIFNTYGPNMEVVIMPRGAQLEHRPRLLWVGKAPRNHGASGEEVFDARTIAALAKHDCDLDLFQPVPIERKREVANLVLGVPYLRARFATTANIEAVRRMSRSYDAVICSWEAMDALALNLRRPTIFIPH